MTIAEEIIAKNDLICR